MMESPFGIAAVYVVVWSVVIFMVLPFGVRPTTKDDMEPGQEPGAPAKPMMWRKVLITSIISALVCLLIYYIDQAGLISFRPD
jgi:predicted secreted protein